MLSLVFVYPPLVFAALMVFMAVPQLLSGVDEGLAALLGYALVLTSTFVFLVADQIPVTKL